MSFLVDLEKCIADERDLEAVHTGVTIDYPATRAEHRRGMLVEVKKMYLRYYDGQTGVLLPAVSRGAGGNPEV